MRGEVLESDLRIALQHPRRPDGWSAGVLFLLPARPRRLAGIRLGRSWRSVDIGWLRRRGAVPFAFAALVLSWFQLVEPEHSWGGIFLICVGEALRLWAAGHLRKDEVLTTSGPYAFVRNPLYIGSLAIATGFALMLRAYLLIVPLLAGFALAYRAETRREENALRQKFGAVFDHYREAVPAWIPRLSRYPQAGREPFRWRRVLRNREYDAVLGILLLFLAADMLEDVLAPWLTEGKPLGKVLAKYLRHFLP